MQSLIFHTHFQWHEVLFCALSTMDKDYLAGLQRTKDWLPGQDALFAAFRRPLMSTKYLLLGESPYPRVQSANGYAFWDESVQSLWSPTGLSKEVNKATSLRHLMKMLLLARGDLSTDFSQEAIARLDKSRYWQTATELFTAFLQQGFLLLNASLVYREGEVDYHARQWAPFISSVLNQLADRHLLEKLVLFGRIAKKVPEAYRFSCLLAEHPYNLSFITNPDVRAFFSPLDLLAYHENSNID